MSQLSRQQLNMALNLSRTIFRLHKKKLPEKLRLLGDIFVKDEFRSHCLNGCSPGQFEKFITEWQKYSKNLEGQEVVRGERISRQTRSLFSSDQKKQLLKLKQSVRKDTDNEINTN